MPKCLKIIFSEFILLLTLISFLSVFFLIGSETSRVYAATYTSCSDLYAAFGSSGTTITVSVNTTLQAGASNLQTQVQNPSWGASEKWGVIDCTGYDVVVNDGVTLTMDAYDDNDTDYTDDYGVLLKADNLTVTGIISGNGQGYGSVKGPGTGVGGTSGSGAGYGGVGGRAATQATYGIIYGSALSPIALGSGGGNDTDNAVAGSNGGGAVRFDIAGNLTNNGTVSVNANNGGATASPGAGSGGSVYVKVTGALTGTGIFTANGGVGGAWAGSGGGGRIAVYYGTGSDISGLTDSTATGGVLSGGGGDRAPGQAGTVGFFSTTSTPANLAVYTTYEFVNADASSDAYSFTNVTFATGSTVLVENSGNAKTINIAGSFAHNGTFTLKKTTTLNVTGTTTLTSGTITGSGNLITFTLNNTGNVTVDASSTINFNGTGYGSATGDGAGVSGISASGAGHGGVGGRGHDTATIGISYGSAQQPITPGSGGGADTNGGTAGGAGGGVIRLNSTGDFTNNGTLSVNGGTITANEAGGGSGGSIYVTVTGAISGTGIFTANGGGARDWAGGGSGGRVAIYYGSGSNISGLVDSTSSGGAGGCCNGDRAPGQAGTVGFFSTTSTPANLAVYTTYEFVNADASSDAYSFTNVTFATGSTVLVENSGNAKTINIAGSFAHSGTFTLKKSTTMNVTGTTTLTSGTINGSGNLITFTLNNTGNVTVDASSSINFNGTGYGGATGDGAGVSGISASGAGHGGVGGRGHDTATIGISYGSAQQPITYGSGGGADTNGPSSGGAGGGIIRLNLTGDFTNNGTLSVNANNGGGATANAGGGSGGSIYVTVTGAISGTGIFTANGGVGGDWAGSGGGGRIAVYYGTDSDITGLTDSTATGGVLSGGGGDRAPGQAGTVGLYGVPNKPTLTISSENIVKNTSLNPTLTGSAYSGDGSHINSDWEIVTTNDCTNGTQVWYKNDDTTNKTSIVVNSTNGTFTGALAGQTTLPYNTTYYACVRYNNSLDSIWSTARSFITQQDSSSAATYNWDFNTASEYAVVSGNTEVSGNAGKLTDLGGGTYTITPLSNTIIKPNLVFPSFIALKGFVQTYGAANAGSAKYQLSCDGTNWYYHPSGDSVWTQANNPVDTSQMSTATVVNGYLGDFISALGGSCGSGFRFRSYLVSDGTQPVEIDNIALKYFGVPNTPSITAPANSATDISRALTITSSAYSGSLTHLNTDFEIYDNAGLAANNRVWYKNNDESNKTSIVVNSSNGTFENGLSGMSKLAPGTQYYVRVRHENSQGNSSWSEAVSFTTIANNAPNTPVNQSPADSATGVVFTPALSTSSYSDADNDTHKETQWLVYASSDDCSNNLTASAVINLSSLINLTSYVVSPALSSTSTYYWRARYRDFYDSWSNYSSCTSFSTLATMPDNPVNLLPANTATSVVLNATLQATDFNDADGDSHQSSQWLIYSSSDNCTNNISPTTDSSTDNVNLTTYTVGLTGNSTYFWRVRYQDNNNNWTDYSSCTSFSTLATTPSAPVNQTPANSAIDVAIRPALVGSAFSDADGDTHQASQWQVFTSSDDCTNNTNPAVNSGTDSVNLTSLIINQNSQPLIGNSQYFWRVRYQDIRNNWTDYSSCTSFSTIPTVPDQPTITSISNGSTNIKRRPTVTGSSYVSPQAHLSTDVQISSDAAFGSVVADCVDYTGENKESLIVNPSSCVFTPAVQALDINTEYFVRLRYSNSNGDSAWSNTVSFTTTYPRIIQNISNQTWNKNTSLTSAFNLDNHFALTDGEAVTYSVLNTPQFITITINLDHSVSFSPSANKIGEAVVIFRMTDAYGSFIDSNPVTLLVIDPDVGADLGSKDNIPDLPDDDPIIDDLPDDPQDTGITLPGEDEHDSPDEEDSESRSGEDESDGEENNDEDINAFDDDKKDEVIDYPDFGFEFPEEELEIIDIVDDGIAWQYDLPLMDGLKPIVVDTNLPDDEKDITDDNTISDDQKNIPDDNTIPDNQKNIPDEIITDNPSIDQDNSNDDMPPQPDAISDKTEKEVVWETEFLKKGPIEKVEISVPTLTLIYDNSKDDNENQIPDDWEIIVLGNQNSTTKDSDSDNDGLTDYEEYKQNSDPSQKDTDHDGIMDYDEIEMGLMVNNPDSDNDGFSDLVEIEAGSDPLNSSLTPNDLNGNQVDDDWENKHNIQLLNGWQDTDVDGCSDKIEYTYLSNPLLIDSDNDGYLDCEEISEFKTNPIDKNSKPNFTESIQITNWRFLDSTNDNTPLFKGSGPADLNVNLIIEGENGQTQIIGKGKIMTNNKFILESSGKIKDGSYVFYVQSEKDNGILKSNRILLSVNSQLDINKPEVKRLGSVNILKDVRLEIREGRPILLGKVQEKAQVVVTWSSLLYTSALLIDTKEGDFQSIPPTLLEKGNHKIYLYAYRSNDKTSSQDVKLEFEILEGGVIKIHNDYNVWFVVGFASFFVVLFPLFIYLYKRKKHSLLKKLENPNIDGNINL